MFCCVQADADASATVTIGGAGGVACESDVTLDLNSGEEGGPSHRGSQSHRIGAVEPAPDFVPFNRSASCSTGDRSTKQVRLPVGENRRVLFLSVWDAVGSAGARCISPRARRTGQSWSRTGA